MTENELIDICSSDSIVRPVAPIVYWTSELYGFGKYIRKYGRYPRWLPLAVYSDHSGPSLTDDPYKHELENDAPSFLTHSAKKCEKIRKATGKNAQVMLSPAVFCRLELGISKNTEGKGSIAFPVHSLPSQTEEFDQKKYIQQLRELPEEFQPVTVCLHMHDINKGRHVSYLDAGLEVICAGHPSDDRFVERLYGYLQKTKYTTSNDVGTIAFFSIEMGIPFFVYGAEQVSINVSDENLKAGAVDDAYKVFPLYRFMREKLQYDSTTPPMIDKEVAAVVNEALGKGQHITRAGMSILLWWSLAKWVMSLRAATFFWRKIRQVRAAP